jgi:hypothetical protein
LFNVLLVRLQVSSLIISDIEGNVIFQEAPLPKAGKPDPKALIERDWNTGMRIGCIGLGVL